LKNESEKLDIITAYKELGSYRGAADLCGTSHKTVARVVAAFEADGGAGLSKGRAERVRNYEDVRELVAAKIAATAARISAKRLLPVARAAGYAGSDRNFRVSRSCAPRRRSAMHRLDSAGRAAGLLDGSGISLSSAGQCDG